MAAKNLFSGGWKERRRKALARIPKAKPKPSAKPWGLRRMPGG